MGSFLIILALGLGGFVFPPIWIVLVIYVIWIWIFKRPLRAGIIKKDIGEMVSRGETLTRIDVSFNEAKAYAIENGARPIDVDHITMSLIVNGRPRKVAFSRSHRPPGTWVRFEDD